ncbi:MAG TPA: imidazole glycerol phosphate synthase subunit HisH [Rhizomicrobium sp.]|jgi:glutamine amidotransferase|nr:imidazole glycerol phosphate synthase subunit HisH [Rhizomicrobium sp.]
MIAIIDYGMGNSGSIKNMLRRLGVASHITSDHQAICEADKLILPGVGAFDAGMKNLHDRGLAPLLDRRVREERVPVLGICLGMQLMTRGSDEGKRPGLGWIDAEARRFSVPPGSRLKVPHMGWAPVVSRKSSALVAPSNQDELRFYFVHSYYIDCHDGADVLLQASHGNSFVAGFERDNILGVQFHPEKSHKFGLKLLENFATRYR